MKKHVSQMDAKGIINKLQLEDDRAKTTLYLSKGIYQRFKKACGKAPASRVIEELMREFLERLK